jgi:hypothetical protein
MLHWFWIIVLTVLALVVVIVLLCVLNYIGEGVGWDLYPSIFRSRRGIRRILKMRGEKLRVSSFGATHIDPRYLCVCIDVDTDAERDAMRDDNELIEDFRDAILAAGYPVESVPLVSFSIESQQTVDRDWSGNWFHARK